jgi:hypothetical protein
MKQGRETRETKAMQDKEEEENKMDFPEERHDTRINLSRDLSREESPG